MRFFRNTPAEAPAPKALPRLNRRSSAMAELSRMLKSEQTLCVLDIGATSASNIRFFTERGHRVTARTSWKRRPIHPSSLAMNRDG